MSGTRDLSANIPGSPIVRDAPDGEVRVEWRAFFQQLWSRTGGAQGSTINGVVAGTGLSGGGSSGTVTLALVIPVAIVHGGTGATTAPQALTNLGAVARAGDTMTGFLTLAADPTAALEAATKQYTDARTRWVPYTTAGQAFAQNDMTRDGDWTMIANTATTDRPAPQASGAEEDLLGAWAPAQQNARATYTVYNEWTLNQAGWVNQYGIDVIQQNTGSNHAISLSVNGTTIDTFTAVPTTSGSYWHDITPVLVASGAVIRVTLTVTETGNILIYWLQQTGWFATAPNYCSGAVGSKDGAAAGTTAYGCHLMFVPGTSSPHWDVVAYGGSAAGAGGGGGGVGEAPTDGQIYGRQGSSTAWLPVLPLTGGTLTGALILAADPATALESATKQYVDTTISNEGALLWG